MLDTTSKYSLAIEVSSVRLKPRRLSSVADTALAPGGGMWMPEPEPLSRLRRDVDRRSYRLKEILMESRLRREYLDGAAKDEKKVVKAFVGQSQENALKTKPKVRIASLGVSCPFRSSVPRCVISCRMLTRSTQIRAIAKTTQILKSFDCETIRLASDFRTKKWWEEMASIGLPISSAS